MQLLALRQAFDGAQIVAFGLDREHQAGTDQLIIERDAARAAIAGRAAFLGAGQAQRPAQRIEHGIVGLAEEFRRLAVDGGGYVELGHEYQFPLARWAAIAVVRLSNTPATLVR